MKSLIREIIITATLAAALFLGVQMTIQTFEVDGTSMLPSFQDGERVLVNKLVYRLHEPERGDVIVFQPPNDRRDFIKRVIGLPGDTVEIHDYKVFINGQALDEPYIYYPSHYTLEKQVIPDNSYFVLGDNRDHSNDSHTGWVAPRENIVGKAWVTIWPPDKVGLVPDFELSQLTDVLLAGNR